MDYERQDLTKIKEFKIVDCMKDVDSEQINKLIKRGWIVIDVRTMKTSHYVFLEEHKRVQSFDRIYTRFTLGKLQAE